jgi:hypothetical protein
VLNGGYTLESIRGCLYYCVLVLLCYFDIRCVKAVVLGVMFLVKTAAQVYFLKLGHHCI